MEKEEGAVEASVEPIQVAKEDQKDDDVTEGTTLEESNEQRPPVEEHTDEPEKNEPNEQEDPEDNPAIQVDYELWIIFHFPLRMYSNFTPLPSWRQHLQIFVSRQQIKPGIVLRGTLNIIGMYFMLYMNHLFFFKI